MTNSSGGHVPEAFTSPTSPLMKIKGVVWPSSLIPRNKAERMDEVTAIFVVLFILIFVLYIMNPSDSF